jgi:hypothetical protein
VRKNKKAQYIHERWATIALTTVSVPFGTFVGYEFGAGHTKTALLALGIQTVIVFLQAYIWWLAIEKINKN